MFQLAPGGIPIRRAPAALARRFQQICVAMIAEVLAGGDVTQLEYAVLVFLDDLPGIDQRRLAEALGIDRNNTGVLVELLEKACDQAGLVFLTSGEEPYGHRLPSLHDVTTYGRMLRTLGLLGTEVK